MSNPTFVSDAELVHRVVYAIPPEPLEDQIDLIEIGRSVWDRRWVVLIFVLMSGLFSIALAFALPEKYRSEALLAPTANEQQSALAGLASRFGGLAAIAGVDVPKGVVDKTVLAMETLKSRTFLIKFAHRRNMVIPLMAGVGWSDSEQRWHFDKSVYDVASGQWGVRPDGTSAAPSDLEIYKRLLDIVRISQDPETGLVRLSVTSRSPVDSQRWVEWLVADLNQHLRESDVEKTETAIAYLQANLEKTPLADLRGIMFGLIEQQIQERMVAEVTAEYAFRVLDPPVVPEERAEPNRKVIALAGTFAGAVLGILVALIHAALRSKRSQ